MSHQQNVKYLANTFDQKQLYGNNLSVNPLIQLAKNQKIMNPSGSLNAKQDKLSYHLNQKLFDQQNDIASSNNQHPVDSKSSTKQSFQIQNVNQQQHQKYQTAKDQKQAQSKPNGRQTSVDTIDSVNKYVNLHDQKQQEYNPRSDQGLYQDQVQKQMALKQRSQSLIENINQGTNSNPLFRTQAAQNQQSHKNKITIPSAPQLKASGHLGSSGQPAQVNTQQAAKQQALATNVQLSEKYDQNQEARQLKGSQGVQEQQNAYKQPGSNLQPKLQINHQSSDFRETSQATQGVPNQIQGENTLKAKLNLKIQKKSATSSNYLQNKNVLFSNNGVNNQNNLQANEGLQPHPIKPNNSISQSMGKYNTSPNKNLDKNSMKVGSGNGYPNKTYTQGNLVDSSSRDPSQQSIQQQYQSVNQKQQVGIQRSPSAAKNPLERHSSQNKTQNGDEVKQVSSSEYYATSTPTPVTPARTNPKIKQNAQSTQNMDPSKHFGLKAKTQQLSKSQTGFASQLQVYSQTDKSKLSQNADTASHASIGSIIQNIQKMKDPNRDFLKKKGSYQSLSNQQKTTFGFAKNSVKPPQQKKLGLHIYQQYNPKLHHQTKLKQSHSSLGVQNCSTESLKFLQTFNQIKDRLNQQIKKDNSQSIIVQAATGKRSSSLPINAPHQLNNKDSNKSQNSRKDSDSNEQERILLLAEQEQEDIELVIAQTNQYNIEMNKKRGIEMNQAQKNMQALSNKAAFLATQGGSVERNNTRQRLDGYKSEVRVSLKESQASQVKKSNQTKSKQMGPTGMMIPKRMDQPGSSLSVSSNKTKQISSKPLKNFNRHSPIDLPSSSNSSKQSNQTPDEGLTNSESLTVSRLKYEFAPEVRQITKQFNEIVKCLQKLEENTEIAQGSNSGLISFAPQISSVIAKIYSVKSSYDQVVQNLSVQLQKIQQHNQQTTVQQQYMGATQQQNMQVKQMNPKIERNQNSQYIQLTPHGQRDGNPPHSAASFARQVGNALLPGTGGSINRCKYCKGVGQAPSSNSVSERQTYAGASARADQNTNDHPKITVNSHPSVSSQREELQGGTSSNGPDTVMIDLPTQNQQDPYSQSQGQDKKCKTLSAQNQQTRLNQQSQLNQKSYSFRVVFQQIQKLTEDNKKIQQLEDLNRKINKQHSEKEKLLQKAEQNLLQSQRQLVEHTQEIKELKTTNKDLGNRLNKFEEQQRQRQKQNQLRNFDKQIQTTEDPYFISEKELDLLVDIEKLKKKLRKTEKEKLYNSNKISKFIYFFFTLQNKGIPVNEIYEKDGVKFIKTDRFQELMGQNGQQNGTAGEDGGNQQICGNIENTDQKGTQEDEQNPEFSFYSDDSYEYIAVNRELAQQSRFKNIRNKIIAPLNFEELPEYETTEDEEEDEGEQQIVDNNQQEELSSDGYINEQEQMIGINSPTPHTRLAQSNFNQSPKQIMQSDNHGPYPNQSNYKQGAQNGKSMNPKHYKQSIQYIERFYEKNQQNQQQQVCQQQNIMDQTGTLFDDAPQSVTEESFVFAENQGTKSKKLLGHNKVIARHFGNSPPTVTHGRVAQPFLGGNNDLADGGINAHNFDQSERFDDSIMTPQARAVAGNGNNRHGSNIGMGIKDANDVLGMSIDSQSFDQSIIDQSIELGRRNARQSNKQKQDLDGSKLFRDNKANRDSAKESTKKNQVSKKNLQNKPSQVSSKNLNSPTIGSKNKRKTLTQFLIQNK